MSAFPTLSKGPRSVTATPVDNSVKCQPEDGTEMARKRGTKELWIFEVEYPPLGSADIDLLLHPTTGFWNSVGTYDVFTWTWETITYNVRFQSPIKRTQSAQLNKYKTISFTLKSV